MSIFGRTIKMENLFGNDPKWKFENAYFEEEAPTMKEAIALVEKDIADYIKAKKKPKDDLPFETPKEVDGIKLLRNK